MKVIEMRTEDLIPYENNPRKNDNAVDAVANSIKEFGFLVPIVVNKDNVIVAGHTRLKAAKKLGLFTVPVVLADGLTEEQINAFRLADNKTGELASWDLEKLEKELGLVGDFDMSDFGFEALEELEEQENRENPYSKGVKIPQYEPSGADVGLDECFDDTKTNELIKEIDASNVPEEYKRFLRMAAYRHTVFNYKNIAELYAKAEPEVQRLMEASALVIIDINDAIANGWVKMSKTIQELLEYEE